MPRGTSARRTCFTVNKTANVKRLYGFVLTALLATAFAGQAQAQSLADYDYANLSFRGIGVDVGYIWPTKVESTPSYNLRLDLGFLGPGIRIAPVISYWSSKMRDSEIQRFADQLNRLEALRDRGVVIDASELGQIDWSDLSLSVDAHVVWTTPVALITYLGVGAGVHALNGRGDAIAGTFVEDLLDSTTAAGAIMAGVEGEVFPSLRIYGEARYTLMSDVRYPGVRAGLAFMLPRTAVPAGDAR